MPRLRRSLDSPQTSGAAQLALAGRTHRAALRSSNAARAFPRNIGEKTALFLNEQCSPNPTACLRLSSAAHRGMELMAHITNEIQSSLTMRLYAPTATASG